LQPREAIATVQEVDRCNPDVPLQQCRGRPVAAQKDHCNSSESGPLQPRETLLSRKALQQSKGWTVAPQRGHCNNSVGGPLQPRGALATIQRVDCYGLLQPRRALATIQGVDRCNPQDLHYLATMCSPFWNNILVQIPVLNLIWFAPIMRLRYLGGLSYLCFCAIGYQPVHSIREK